MLVLGPEVDLLQAREVRGTELSLRQLGLEVAQLVAEEEIGPGEERGQRGGRGRLLLGFFTFRRGREKFLKQNKRERFILSIL